MRASGKACLTCDHVHFIAEPDWKPGYAGGEYDRHDAIRSIRKNERHINARCAFWPEWITVTTAHYCGQWTAPPFEKHAKEVIWGSWDKQQTQSLRDEVKELKTALKKAREISAARLARLQAKDAR